MDSALDPSLDYTAWEPPNVAEDANLAGSRWNRYHRMDIWLRAAYEVLQILDSILETKHHLEDLLDFL